MKMHKFTHMVKPVNTLRLMQVGSPFTSTRQTANQLKLKLKSGQRNVENLLKGSKMVQTTLTRSQELVSSTLMKLLKGQMHTEMDISDQILNLAKCSSRDGATYHNTKTILYSVMEMKAAPLFLTKSSKGLQVIAIILPLQQLQLSSQDSYIMLSSTKKGMMKEST